MAERGGAVRGAAAGSTVTSAGGLTAAHEPSSSARPTTDSESSRAVPAKPRGVRWR